ncbi:MAG: TonB-dependent receptor [Nostoc sp.]|uniref:TonB-dependent receptor n=1 Tax=Nostoc sp. TaxID=1180 RepID=UPI002FFA10CA
MKSWWSFSGSQLCLALSISAYLSALVITPTSAQVKSKSNIDFPVFSKAAELFQVERGDAKGGQTISNSRRIRQLGEDEPTINKAQPLLAQSPTSAITEITGVKANPTQKGVEVILQTTQGEQLQLINRSTDNNFITDIPNAQLRLPGGQGYTFRSEKPLAGITEIIVTNFNANTIRVRVVGEQGLPTVELFDSNEGLIFGVASTATATQPEPEKPASQTAPEQPTAEGDKPIELVVTGEQDTYRATDGSTATKTDTPLRDIPQSIQVVPKQVLQDQQVTNLGDALRNVPGVSQGGQPFSRSILVAPIIRGFNSTTNVLTDGLQNGTYYFSSFFEPAGIEQIEVLKGPASVLYGQGPLGGIVNLITKKPLSEPFYRVEATAGSFNFYRGAVDLSGPLNSSKTVLYRLNVAAQTTESFVDSFNGEQYFVAPALSWQISDRTKLTLQAQYFKQRLDFGQQGLPLVGTVLPNPNGKIPRDRYYGEDFSQRRLEVFQVGYNLEHRFSDNWQLRHAFRGTWAPLRDNFIANLDLASDNRTLDRGYFKGGNNERGFNVDTYLVGKFATGSIQHQLVTGFNYIRYDAEQLPRFFAPATPIDLFNPVYGQPLQGTPTQVAASKFHSNAFGIYIQDQIALFDNLKLLLGGRFDIANQRKNAIFPLPASTESKQQEVFSPRVGVVYQPIPAISLYASYSQSFVPSQAFNSDIIPLPERGRQYEVGIKADLSDRLSATLAFYDLTRTNVSTDDPNRPGFSIQVGEQQSQGIELNLAGEILPGWNIIAGYAYTDAQITKDNTFAVGNLLNNVPKHSFNVWTTYEIQSGSLKGFGVGAGVFYTGDRQGDLENTFELPGYFRTDAAIFYKRDNLRAAINFKNLFNVDYFESASNRLNVYYGDPFTVQGTISWEF